MYTIRENRIGDLYNIACLFDQYRVFYGKTSDVGAASNFLQERIKTKTSVIFVCENEDGRLVGFTQLYPLFSSTRMKKLWLLNDLYVAPEFRSNGISVALIDRAKVLCQETKACGLMLETAKSNLIGNNLYPKTGFSVDEDHNYYSWDV